MLPLSKELDILLLDLAWSMWTELGVAGLKRKHQRFLITLEELILLTMALAEVDPRLRDESLDWCTEYHHFCSISRLKSIAKGFENLLDESFSRYSATLNALCKTNWPVFQDSPPLNISLSRKSCLRPLESPALLNIRVRSIFGTGARADLVTFFLTHKKTDFSVSDVAEIGYTKRNLAEILEEFSLSGLFDKFLVRNQQRYRLIKSDQLMQVLGPIPEFAPSWRQIFEVLLSLRQCIKRSEKSSDSSKVVEIRNLLISLQQTLQRLNLPPPPSCSNFQDYLRSFSEWLIGFTRKIAQGDFPDPSFLKIH
ncbi:MAG: hypothetical protein LLG04_05510 [Parachlamydia sp.]|nr:hypothetical protein [Parachlamydia sp.]